MSPEGALDIEVWPWSELNDGKILKGCSDLPRLSNPESYNPEVKQGQRQKVGDDDAIQFFRNGSVLRSSVGN
jgi:hypothetical protein